MSDFASILRQTLQPTPQIQPDGRRPEAFAKPAPSEPSRYRKPREDRLTRFSKVMQGKGWMTAVQIAVLMELTPENVRGQLIPMVAAKEVIKETKGVYHRYRMGPLPDKSNDLRDAYEQTAAFDNKEGF